MDIIVERVFPSGYVDLAKNTKHGTWNEEEERIKADEWEVSRCACSAVWLPLMSSLVARTSEGAGSFGRRDGEDGWRLGRHHRAPARGCAAHWTSSFDCCFEPGFQCVLFAPSFVAWANLAFVTDAEEPDEILDRIESAKNKDAVVDRLSAAQVYGCLQLASENAQKDRFQAISDLEKDLEVRPSHAGFETCC